jgi:L-alanine-DL-glutamate epimerase-like enolase superfamily enzyme
MLKIKGGLNPDNDVQRIKAIQRSLPNHTLRLDADGGYDIQSALDVSRALENILEMLEQPTSPDDLKGLRRITHSSSLPILADQSVAGPESALQIAAGKMADCISVKMATCGGFRCADQINLIAQAAGISTMVGCIIEPALLISAGLHFALSNPNIEYGDLDGHLDLSADPTVPGFRIEDGWLIVSDYPGLGCTVDL